MKLKRHNEVAQLQKNVEAQQADSLRQLSQLDRKLEDVADRTLQLGKIRLYLHYDPKLMS
jgi:hypothetical protein